jgi:hypothetical protein
MSVIGFLAFPLKKGRCARNKLHTSVEIAERNAREEGELLQMLWLAISILYTWSNVLLLT